MDYDAPYAYDVSVEYDSATDPYPVGGTYLFGEVGIRPLLGGKAGVCELLSGLTGLDSLSSE